MNPADHLVLPGIAPSEFVDRGYRLEESFAYPGRGLIIHCGPKWEGVKVFLVHHLTTGTCI